MSYDYMAGQFKEPPLSVFIDKGGSLMGNFDKFINILLEYEEMVLSKIEKSRESTFQDAMLMGQLDTRMRLFIMRQLEKDSSIK